MAGANGRGVEGTGAERCVLAGDAAVHGVGGIDDEAVGDWEAVDGREDNTVEEERAVIKAGNMVHYAVSVIVLAMVGDASIYLPTLFGWQAAYSVG